MRGRKLDQQNRSKPSFRQYRLQLIKITENLPYGEFFAYCIVSKQSPIDISIHQRLLTINTHSKQLSCYNVPPQLPINSLKDLGERRQVVNYKTANRFEFVLEMIRNGHVNIRWLQKNQVKSWKLIMGNNKIAQELQNIIVETSGRSRIDGLPKNRKNSNSNPKQTSFLLNRSSKNNSAQKQDPVKEENFQIKVIQPEQLRNESEKKRPQQIDLQSDQKIHKPELYSPISLDNQESEQKDRKKGKIDSEYVSISINRGETVSNESQKKKKYTKHDSLVQKKQTDIEGKQKTQSLTNQWLQSSNSLQKAAVYLKFVQKCKKKIELIMQNFFASHLQHEQQDEMCVLYDGETKYYYYPLVQSLENEETPQSLANKILYEEQYFREFQCLEYLSSLDRVAQFKIFVPMACIISFKAMRFYCKSTLDFINNKSLITKETSKYSVLISQIEKKCHLKLNDQEEIYEIYLKEKVSIVYFNKIRFLPQISSNLPISREYVESYITEGVISGDKDIRVINNHIMSLISQDLIQLLTQRHVFSCFQMMANIQKLGLSYHYLPRIIQQAQFKNLPYLYRVLQSELLVKTMQWQIRRKMQLQIFKKRQFGFSLNQVKMSINMLFQEQKYYLRVLSKIANSFFGFSWKFQSQTVESNIVGQMALASLLHKLGFSCRVDIQDKQYKGWIWKELNIADRLEITPYLQVTAYNSSAYNENKNFLEKCLIKQLNFQIQETQVQSVLSYMGVEKDRHGFYLVSPTYHLLNQNIKTEVNYYLSHFLTPSHSISPVNVLQSTIYHNLEQQKLFQTSFQSLILLNKLRWLIKEGYKLKAEELIEKQITKAELWNQSLALIQIYDFYSKYKFKFGEVRPALNYSLKSLEIALLYYQQVKTLPAELLIAQQAFSAANFHFLTHDFSKALSVFSIAQQIIKKINTEGQNITLNPEFILLYARKCQIFLVFGEYQHCLDQCLEGLKCCGKFTNHSVRLFVDQNEFKIYEILFRCYETKNMRKEMIQVASICIEKYFQDKLKLNQPIDQNLLSEVIKLLWISIVKQVEVISPLAERSETQIEDIKYIYLKKVHKQLILLAKRLKFQYRYSKKEVTDYFVRKIMRQSRSKNTNMLKHAIVDCLASITMSSSGFQNDKLFDEEALESPWLMLQGITCITSYEFLVGVIQNSLHMYTFQY